MKTENQDFIGALNDIFTSVVRTEDGHGRVNMVDGLFAIAKSIDGLSKQVKNLGNGNACTDMGAIEAYSVVVKEGFSEMTEAITKLAAAVEDIADKE